MLNRIVIPDMTGGVSRQPDGQRFPNQVEEATNVFIHMAKGLEKRSGSEFVFQATNLADGVGVYWIDRSTTQRYVVLFHQDASTPLHIRKIDGTACTVTYQNPGGAIETALKAYLNTAYSNLKAITVDDTTIVVNTTVVTSFSASTSSYQFGGTNVDNSANAHNKASWEEFDLPPTGASEYWYARDDALGHPAGWYQVISTTNQPWYERKQTPMANSTYTFSTMPIRIVQTGDTTFEVRQCVWVPRKSGDDLTNPGPSFVGKAITDLCVHRNRLWFAAGENIIGSQSGDFYNFWLNSYASVVDSDPIDVKLSSSQVTKVSWLAPFQRMIVVFTESGQQYEIRAAEALTPTTVSVVPSTTYTSPVVRPAIVGSQLYWAAPKTPTAQVFEYITDDSSAVSVASDTAAHVDGYISSSISELKASPSNDLLFLRDGSVLYVNYMFWQGDKKIQSSWVKWTFQDDHTVLGMNVFDHNLYVFSRVTETGTNRLRMDKIPLRHNETLPSYRPRIDNQFTASGVWDAATKTTTFTYSSFVPGIDNAYLGSAWGNQEGLRLNVTSSTATGSTTTVVVSGRWDAHPVYFGSTIDSEVKMSRQYVRDQNGVPAVGALQLKQCTVHHRNTGYFTFTVDPRTDPASDRVYKYTGKQIGSIGFITNTNVLSDKDSQNFKVMNSASGVDLYIRSDSPAPFNITGIEFMADFVAARRSAAST